jgi:CTP:molybdopterin cytidylyltransferase MocA
MEKTAAIILAAGASRRLGRPKQRLILQDETLLERAARIAKEARLAPVIVVLKPELDFGYAMQQLGCLVVMNPDSAEGIASSICYGIRTATLLKASGVVLMTCDQVGLTPDHLRALIAEPGRITGSAYADRMGIPAYFPAKNFPDLLKLKGDTGARDLLRTAYAVTDEDLALDIDIEADYAEAKARYIQ